MYKEICNFNRHPHLFNYILVTIPNKYPVVAYGSWGSYEAHLPDKKNGIISSLSDIDYITKSVFLEDISYKIKNEIEKWSRLVRLTIAGVSIRSNSTIENLWSSQQIVNNRQYFSFDQYIAFWSIIGMLDFAKLVNKNQYVSDAIITYGIVKYFFCLSRTLFSRMGLNPSSYISLVNTLERFCPSNSLIAALQVKIGIYSKLSKNDLYKLFSPSFYKLISSNILTYSTRELVLSNCQTIANCSRTSFQLPIKELYSLGASYIQSDYQIEALSRAVEKLRNSNVNI